MMFLEKYFEKLKGQKALEPLPDYKDVIRKAYLEALDNWELEDNF